MAEPSPSAMPKPVAGPSWSGDWPALVRAMGLAGLTQQLANHCALVSMDENQIVLALDPQSARIRTAQLESKLEKALQDHLMRPVKLAVQVETPPAETPAVLIQRRNEDRQKAAELEIEQDPTIRALKDRLEARVVPGSIKPID